MARTCYALYPGFARPDNISWTHAPELLAPGDLWEHVRKTPIPGLLFRVRTENEPGANMETGDRIESCVGMVDSTVRWRAALAMARASLFSLRNSAIINACGNAMGLLTSRHPAVILTPERQQAQQAIREAVDGVKVGNPQEAYEAAVAHGVARLMMVDNDFEAASLVPFNQSWLINVKPDDRAALDQRMTTLEVVASSVVLVEAVARLHERMPEWLYSKMPEVTVPGAERRGAASASERGEEA